MIKNTAFRLVMAIVATAMPAFIHSQIVINEVMVNPVSNCDGSCNPNTSEWTELLNNSALPADISCYVLTDGDWSVTFPPGTILPPFGLITIGSSGSMINGLDIDIASCNCTSGGSGEIGVFTNGNEQVVIANHNGEIIDGIYWGAGQFGQTMVTSSLFGCPSLSIPILQENPAIVQAMGNIGQEEPIFLLCDGTNVIIGNNSDATPGVANILNPQTIVSNAIVTNETCGGLGSISVDPSDGLGPYQIFWSGTTNTGNDLNGLQEGVYSVSIVDQGQCNYSQLFEFELLDLGGSCDVPDSILMGSADSLLVSCSAGGSLVITDNGGVNGNMTYDGGLQVMEVCSDSWDVNLQMTLDNWELYSDNFTNAFGILMVYPGPYSEIQQAVPNLTPMNISSSPIYDQLVFDSQFDSQVGVDSILTAADTCYTILVFYYQNLSLINPYPGFEATVTCVEPLNCLLDLSSIIVNDCDSINQIYSIEFDIVLNNTVNGSYDIALSLDGVVVDTVSVTSGVIYPHTMANIPVDTGANHVVFAEVLGSAGCNAEGLYASIDCVVECNTQAGTGVTGPTSKLLCFGQNQNWSATGTFISSADVNNPNVAYNPGMAWAIYSDVPTIFSGDITSDPAYAGIWPASISAIDGTYPFNFMNNTNNGTAIHNILTGNAGYPSPQHFYAAPVTLYNYTDTVVYVPGGCSSIGNIVEITIVPAISYSLPTSSCLDGTVTYNPTQGNTAVNDNYFQLSGLTPNTVFATPIGNLTNGADLTIGGLVDGDVFSFTLTDTLGCAITINGGPFVGDQTPSSPGAPDICQASEPVQLLATPAGGVWSGPGIDALGMFNPDLVGAVGNYVVTYTTSGPCGGSIDITVPVLTNDNCINGTINPIGTDTVVACGGFLTDDGLQADSYTPNFNDTTVICPDPTLPIDQISALSFLVFELGFGDQFSLYNGPSVTSPLIGNYQGTDINGQSFYSTDPSGCLTAVFISDADASVGNFSAEITCGIPCSNPVVHITTNESEVPHRICQGETVNFSGATTEFFNDGIYQSHSWQVVIVDSLVAIDTTNYPNFSYTFDDPAAYLIQLFVTDTNGCTNTFLTDYLIEVSTTPIIDLSTSQDDDQICTGAPLDLQADFATVFWADVPEPELGGALFIPDDQTQCFSDTLNFDSFDAGLTITSTADIQDVFLNMEHSFMGDFVITLYCPDGSSLVMHQQGGGGTLLGEPVDVDTDLSPGIGYDYYFTPNSTNGTWVANAGGTLPPGDYASVQPFTNLLGCPLNGEWIIEICDLWLSDNGYIFDWNVHFADYMYPDGYFFEPIIGQQCDSSYWTYPNGQIIPNVGGNCDTVSVSASAPGPQLYTYHVIDNHGCEYTDEITVDFYAAPVVALDPVINYCNTNLQLPNATSTNPLTNPAQGITYSYAWTSDSLDFLSATNIPNPTLFGLTPYVATEHQVQYNVLVTSIQDPACFASDSILVNVPPLLIPGGVVVDTVLCQGDEFNLTYPFSTLSDSYTYVWVYSPDVNQVDTVGYESSYTISNLFTTTYTLEVTDQDCDYVDYYYYTVLGDPCTITTYNIFTPNNDPLAQNNTFQIGGLFLCDDNDHCVLKFPGSVLKVYNRWGTLVYENENYDNSWTGEGLAEGTYYYVFLQNFENQDDKYFHGDVYITR